MAPSVPQFSRKFESLRPNLMTYLYRLTTNYHDAEDLLHDTYLKAQTSLDSFQGKSSLKTWIYSIATNLARDRYRVQLRWKLEVQDDCRDRAENHPEQFERMVTAFNNQAEKNFEIVEHINYCFTCVSKNLSFEKQLAIILKEMHGFKRSEIAGIIGVSEAVVKHLLFEGRKELQEKYEHRCALVSKTGACYQCAELNDHFQGKGNAAGKIARLGISQQHSPSESLKLRLKLLSDLNKKSEKPGFALEDVIMQILWDAIQEPTAEQAGRRSNR